MELLKVKNLNFGYKSSAPVFNNLCREINSSPFIHINGISGSGKTTLFKIFAGFIDAAYDELIISDIKIYREMNPYDRNIAMVFQKSALWQHLTAEKNIKLAWNEETI
ncbi:MAG: ABC transporter ATP-binding protein, partial [Chlamydiae bacterium]